ncbi:dihydrofolate reductase family protein [Reinekea sp. G2M2-21]|uniref:dihydrofolate reductase family protein n=1 Tax=Reinekea sp. G2M2-21 TaxID=2788942 RepID=UPI0018A9F7BE|nr:dihydrofolate reductase family protein [Reinekea sp. G2M2-21]
MRKVIYYIATSADGFIADQDGGVDKFLMEGPHVDDFQQELQQFSDVIMGANTYRFGFQYGIQPGQPAYPGLKHWVVSTHLKFPSSQEVVCLSDDVLSTLQSRKELNGPSIWLCGGGELAGWMMAHGLIDEVKLKVNPFFLGQGIPLFGRSSALPARATLKTSRQYSNGVAILHYTVEASG